MRLASKYRSLAFSSRIDCIYSWAMMLTPPFPPLRNDEGVHEICKTWAVNYSTQFSRLLSRLITPDFPAFLINAAYPYVPFYPIKLALPLL